MSTKHIFTPSKEVKKYRESDAKNQSSLKKLSKGLDNYLTELRKKPKYYFEEKDYFKLGDAVDTILTASEEEFKEKFHVVTMDLKLSDAEKSIVKLTFDFVYNSVGEQTDLILGLDQYQDNILRACIEENYYSNLKSLTRVSKILDKEDCRHYFETLKNSVGKIVLSKSEEESINTIVTSLKTNERTKMFFNEELLPDNVRIYYQMPVYFEIDEIPCKALFDIVVLVLDQDGFIDSIHPYDLKTSYGFTIDFPTKVKSLRYDLQAAFYFEALMNPTTKFPKNFPKFKEDSRLNPFTFIVESSDSPGKPLLFELNQEYLEEGRDGKYNVHTGQCYAKGYLTLLKEWCYYERNGWVEEEFITATNGLLLLSPNGVRAYE